MDRTIVNTDRAPAAIGPYSQGVIFGGKRMIMTAGQIAIDPKTGRFAGSDIQSQTRAVIQNLKSVLEAAGSGLAHVVKTTVFLKNMEQFSEMNQVYAEYFPDHPPARSAVEVARLPKDALIEIECIAEIP